MGLRGVDLLQPEEYDVPRRYGLICTMAYAGGGEIKKALNRVENHAAIEQAFRTNIPKAASGAGSERHHVFRQSRGHVR